MISESSRERQRQQRSYFAPWKVLGLALVACSITLIILELSQLTNSGHDARGEDIKHKFNRRMQQQVNHSAHVPLFDHYPANEAVRSEVARHNRLIVDSLAYLNRFSSLTARYERIKAEIPSPNPLPPITVVILAVNRVVPYLAVLISMLLRGHSAEIFLSRLDVHIVNVERRAGKEDFDLFESLQRKLPFVNFHDWTDEYEENIDLISDGEKAWYLANQRLDYIRALKLCKNAKSSSWCIIMEDDAVPCLDFVSKFEDLTSGNTLAIRGERFLRFKQKAKGGALVSVGQNAGDIGKGTEINKEKVGKIKLYMPYNHGHGGDGSALEERDVWNEEYVHSGGEYWKDKAMDSWEANATQLAEQQEVDYKFRYSTHAFGVVAEAYPAAGLSRLVDFLQKQRVRDSDGLGRVRPLDILVNLDFFRQEKDLFNLEISPSLVNHIGYVSEHAKEAISFRRISTDVRFVLGERRS